MWERKYHPKTSTFVRRTQHVHVDPFAVTHPSLSTPMHQWQFQLSFPSIQFVFFALVATVLLVCLLMLMPDDGELTTSAMAHIVRHTHTQLMQIITDKMGKYPMLPYARRENTMKIERQIFYHFLCRSMGPLLLGSLNRWVCRVWCHLIAVDFCWIPLQ